MKKAMLGGGGGAPNMDNMMEVMIQ